MNKWVSVVLCICGLGLGGMMLTGDSDAILPATMTTLPS